MLKARTLICSHIQFFQFNLQEDLIIIVKLSKNLYQKMEVRNSKKLIIIFVLIISLYANQEKKQGTNKNENLYTIQDAQRCFHNQALSACQQKIQTCIRQENCQQQLLLYQDCNFESEYTNQIFNGNCFKIWKNNAIHTKQVIDCIQNTCNLAGYNSQVSLGILYSCTSQSLMRYPNICDQSCQQILKQQISSKVPYQPIQKIYQENPQIKNQNAKTILDIIRKQCIDENGSIRLRQQKQAIQKKLQKQNLYKQMNHQLKNKPNQNSQDSGASQNAQL